MTQVDCSDEEFIALFKEHGASELSKILGITVRNIFRRRKRLEDRIDVKISAPTAIKNGSSRFEADYPSRIKLTITDGYIMIISDCHYWPEIVSTAHRGFCHVSKLLKPKVLVLNGDGFDGATNGRHPPIGWNRKPSVQEELECVEDRTEELRNSCKTAQTFWMMGNHDYRFENKLAGSSPEYRGVHGTRLSDHFPHWKFGISLWVNDQLVIKHRFKGGVHATHNNTVYAGKSMATGHLHSLKATPFSDYNGIRWGADSGTGADPYGPQFEYSEDNPNNHRSGFLVWPIREGVLMWPEIAYVIAEGKIGFRGEIIAV